MEKSRDFEPISNYFYRFMSEGASGRLPQRSTVNSAGYDFYAFEDIEIPSHLKQFKESLDSGKTVKPFCIKTGVKVHMETDEVLYLLPRSSWSTKLGLILANSVGVIDSDYYNNVENEGEIGFLVYNLSPKPIKIKAGEKLGQGIFSNYLKADSDYVSAERIGGYGSTGV